MTRPRAAIVVAIVIASALLVAEAAARMLEPGLSSAGAWPKGRIAEQYDAVSRFAEGGDADVVFAGSSMMQKGIDPRLFSEATGLRSINVALPASTNFMLRPWLTRVVLPKLDPKTVIIGVASRDFNDNGNGPDRALASLVTSPGYRSIASDDWLTELDRTASRFSTLVRVRRSLRDPDNVLDATRRRSPPVPSLRCPPRSRSSERYRVDPTVLRYPQTVLNDYDAGGIQTRELIDTIGELRRRDVDVFLVELATAPGYAELHPDPRSDLRAYRSALRRVVDATGVDMMDATALGQRRYFRDAIHLNCDGARRFTEAVVRYVSER